MDIYYWGGKRGGFWRKPGGFRLFGSGNTAIQYYWDMLLSDCFSAVSAVSTQLWNQKALLLIFMFQDWCKWRGHWIWSCQEKWRPGKSELFYFCACSFKIQFCVENFGWRNCWDLLIQKSIKVYQLFYRETDLEIWNGFVSIRTVPASYKVDFSCDEKLCDLRSQTHPTFIFVVLN